MMRLSNHPKKSAKSLSWVFSLYVDSDLAPFWGDLLKKAANIVVPMSFSALVAIVRFTSVQTFMTKYKRQI